MLNAARLGYPGSDQALALIEAGLSPAAQKESVELAERISGNFTALQQALGRAPQSLESPEAYKSIVEQSFAALDVPAFSLEGPGSAGRGFRSKHAPAQAQSVSEQPRIFTVDEFVSRAEGSHLMALAALNFRPAPESTRDRLSHEHTAFTGSAATLYISMCDPVVRNIERRIEGAFRLPSSHMEPLSVLRYRGGDRYAPHVDYFDAARLKDNLSKGDRAGQRVASFLVYLRPAEVGGETHYLELGKKVQGRERMALCHFNCLPSGEPDPRTLHTGEPVIQGEKWLARTTVRERPFY
jgi:2OG-Fe(II) oxygenase superfamily